MKLCAFALFGVASGFNVVNPATGKCLDLASPCKDGSDKEGCERTAPKDLKKGTNLQLYRCHNKTNQQFEMLENGRLRNPLTGLCVDIQAPCKDDSTKKGCDRVAVKDLKVEANIQLWECHKDTGTLSASYGNQKWSLLSNGQFKNVGSGLCMDVFAHKKQNGKRAKAKHLGDEANVQVYTCHAKGNQIFDFETGELARDVKPVEKFSLLSDSGFLRASSSSDSKVNFSLAMAGVGALVAAAVIGIRARRSVEQSPSE